MRASGSQTAFGEDWPLVGKQPYHGEFQSQNNTQTEILSDFV